MLARTTILLLLACALTAGPAQAAPDRPRWSQPVQISEPLSSELAIASAPDLAVDVERTLHLVWYSVVRHNGGGGPGFADILNYRARRAGAWLPSQPIFTQPRFVFNDLLATTAGDGGARNPTSELRSSLLAAPDGRLHLLTGNVETQWYLHAPLGDVVRTLAIFPARELAASSHGQITASDDATLHMLFSAVPPGLDTVEAPDVCTLCTDVFYRRSEDGGLTWSNPENLSRYNGNDAEPKIVTGGAGQVHAIWEHRDDGAGSFDGIVYQRSVDHGRSWEKPVSLGVPTEIGARSALAATHTNGVMVVYEGPASDGTFYQYSADGGLSWSSPGIIPSVLSRDNIRHSYHRFSLAADGDGRMHLLMVGLLPASASPSPQLLHLIWDGSSWSEPGVLASGAPRPFAPRLVVERGNHLHATWFTSNSAPERDYEEQLVWYSDAPLVAQELAPPPTLPPPPTVTPVVAPTAPALPTPTPLPPVSRDVAAIDGPPLWELRGLQAVAVGLVTAALPIGLLGLMLMLARRR